jgi:hypothetical protein
MKNPKIVKLVLLVKLDNGNVHQVVIDHDYDTSILSLIGKISDEGKINLLDPPIEGIDF